MGSKLPLLEMRRIKLKAAQKDKDIESSARPTFVAHEAPTMTISDVTQPTSPSKKRKEPSIDPSSLNATHKPRPKKTKPNASKAEVNWEKKKKKAKASSPFKSFDRPLETENETL